MVAFDGDRDGTRMAGARGTGYFESDLSRARGLNRDESELRIALRRLHQAESRLRDRAPEGVPLTAERELILARSDLQFRLLSLIQTMRAIQRDESFWDSLSRDRTWESARRIGPRGSVWRRLVFKISRQSFKPAVTSPHHRRLPLDLLNP